MSLEILENVIPSNYLKPGWYKLHLKFRSYNNLNDGEVVHILGTSHCPNKGYGNCKECTGLLILENDDLHRCFSWLGGNDRHEIFKLIRFD